VATSKSFTFEQARAGGCFDPNIFSGTFNDLIAVADNIFYSESTSIPKNPRTDRPVGYAFVDLSTPSEAERAIAELSGKEILDRKVSVQLARKPEPAGEKGATSGGEGVSGGEGEGGRRRPSGRGRGRGRGRGGRGGRAARGVSLRICQKQNRILICQ
jgi:RNA recognition motif-containing protein